MTENAYPKLIQVPMNLETKVLRRKTFFINEPSDNFKKRMALKSAGPQTNTSYSDLCEDNKAFVEIASYDC